MTVNWNTQIIPTMEGRAYISQRQELCSHCGGYLDACQCDNPGYLPPDWIPELPEVDWSDLPEREEHDPTLAARLAESIRDNR